jgi:hypothetical protein
MVVWALTAGIGIYVLAAGITAQRRAAGPAAGPAAGAPARTAWPPVLAGSADEDEDGALLVGAAALATGLAVAPEPAVSRPAGEGSPLLEFIHPALGLFGLTFWIFFVMTGDRLFAWLAFGVVMIAVVAGLSWELINRRQARRRAQQTDGGLNFPPHLIALHGAAAACTVALVVLAAVAATHG